MGALLSWATRGATLRHVRHVAPVHPAAATGLVGEVYHQVEAEFGMLAPPIALHSPTRPGSPPPGPCCGRRCWPTA
ncbi:hypothetical protein ACFQZ4_05300 [Catellatospora coxensis]